MSLTFFQTKDNCVAAAIGDFTVAWIERNGLWSGRMTFSKAPREDLTASDFDWHWASAATLTEFKLAAGEYEAHLSKMAGLNRRNIPNLSTPWGKSHTAREYQPGIIKVTTAGHGGFLLNPDLNDVIDPEWRSRNGEYEEDICWAIVAHTFPELFTSWEMRPANRILKDNWPYIFERLTGTVIPPSESETKRRDAFFLQHSGKWMDRTYNQAKTDPTKTLIQATVEAGPPSNGVRYYLVDTERFKNQRSARGSFAYVIDEALDVRVSENEQRLN